MPQSKRAAIYIRVSSEAQAAEDRVSVEVQEADCRAYCERNGYEIVEIYRDTERYRSGKKMVEPSGSRSDRPGLLAMLAACDAGRFEVLVCWRTDRLYRGVTASVIAIKDRVKAGSLRVEVVNGGFDIQTMEVLAWSAGIENEARRDRHRMGMAGRLGRGKIFLPNGLYGYDVSNDSVIVNQKQAEVVRQIWQWYGEGVSRGEIRKRLIASDAPQAGSPLRKHSWALSTISKLIHRTEYHTGIHRINWGGKDFEFQIPPLIDAETYAAVQRHIGGWKAHPQPNVKTPTLLAGMVRCKACGQKMYVFRHSARVSRKTGRKKVFSYYKCGHYIRQTPEPGCVVSFPQELCDEMVWKMLYGYLSEPKQFEDAIRLRISELQAEEANAAKDTAALTRQLAEVEAQRQRIIDLYSKGTIEESDLESRLLFLNGARASLERDLRERRLLQSGQSDRLLQLAELYRAEVKELLAWTYPPFSAMGNANPEIADKMFAIKKQFVDALVEYVEIFVGEDGEKTVELQVHLGLLPYKEMRDGVLLVRFLSSRQITDNPQDVFHFTTRITAAVTTR